MKLAERKKIAHLMFLSLFDLIDEEKRSELNKWLKKKKRKSNTFSTPRRSCLSITTFFKIHTIQRY